MTVGRTLFPLLLLVLLALSTVVLAKGDGPPKPDAACQSKDDCGFTHMDEGCCWVCSVRVGSTAWVGKLEAFCKAHPGKGCHVPSCGQAYVPLACKQGRCIRN